MKERETQDSADQFAQIGFLPNDTLQHITL